MKCEKCDGCGHIELYEFIVIEGYCWRCPECGSLCLATEKEPVAKLQCSDGLCALRKLSDQFRGEAAQRNTPPQDEFDIIKYDVVETLLYCADEIDKAIKEIST